MEFQRSVSSIARTVKEKMEFAMNGAIAGLLLTINRPGTSMVLLVRFSFFSAFALANAALGLCMTVHMDATKRRIRASAVIGSIVRR